MSRSELVSFLYNRVYDFKTESDYAKFFANILEIISKNDCINEIWQIRCGLVGCFCFERQNLLTFFCCKPKIIEYLLMLGINPNTLKIGKKSSYDIIVRKFIEEYRLFYVDQCDLHSLFELTETMGLLLNYGGDINKIPKIKELAFKNNLDYEESKSINFFLMAFHKTIMTNNNENYILFLIRILNLIIKCDKKYLEESKIKIIPSDLMQQCIFSFTLDQFKQFQIKENNLGNILPLDCILPEYIPHKKNLRIDKLKIFICFNVGNLLEDECDKVYNIGIDYDMNELNFEDLKKLI